MSRIRKLRLFEKHSLKEILFQTIAPSDFRDVLSISELEHVSFSLTDLVDTNRNAPHQKGPITGFILSNGVLWSGCGAIRSQDGYVIQESFPYIDQLDFSIKRGYLKQYPLVSYDEAVATINTVYRNYYHRISDAITRIYGLYHPKLLSLPKIVLCVDPRFTESEKKFIEYLIPANVQLEILPYGRRVTSPQCIHLPYLSSDRLDSSKWFESSIGFVPRECLEWLRKSAYEHFDLKPQAPSRRLYITRRNAKIRRLLNEEEVSSCLEIYGFEVLELENMALEEQVSAFAEAAIVVAQHGAGLTNLLFAQETATLEIMSDKNKQIFFKLLSESRGFDHVQLSLDGQNKNADVKLPLDLLRSEIRKLNIEGLNV